MTKYARMSSYSTHSLVKAKSDDIVLASIMPPIKPLFEFERVHLNVNETAEIFSSLEAYELLCIKLYDAAALHGVLIAVIIK